VTRAPRSAALAWPARRGTLALFAALLAAVAAPSATRAQAGDDEATTPLAESTLEPGPLMGTLARVKSTGAIRLGYRTDTVPFAFLDAHGHPVGFSLELCRAIADEVAAELGSGPLRVEFVKVTAEQRLSLVAAGAVDLDCGSTSSTVERQRQVSFSPTIFVSATRLLVRSDSSIQTLNALRGRTVVVVRGTTAKAVVQDLSKRSGLELRPVEVSDYAAAHDALVSGRADVLAGDEVLLQGLLAKRRADTAYRFVGPELSQEPYALAFQRGDEQLAELVRRVFRRLAEGREIVAIYDRWFVRTLPSGGQLRLPMSRELEELWRIQGLPSDGS
jgi:glutamate/aspartate transport system substrate-binding protein